MTAGYTALREAAAWIDLNSRGRFRARGEDRVRLMHAMSTNHIQQLKPGQGCYAFFLSAQGRILADAWLLAREDHLLLDTEPEVHGPLYAHLDKYIIADDVTLEDARADLAAIGVEGPESAALLAKLGAPQPAAPGDQLPWGEAFVAAISSTGGAGFRIYHPPAAAERLVAALEAAGAIPASAAEARIARIERHRPRYGDEITDRFLVQETQLLHAVHFNKGCYLGQEIVERVRSRGQVHRLLVPITLETAEPPAAGAALASGGTKSGEIVSAVFSPALGKCVGFAYVQTGFAKPGARLEMGEVAVEVAAAKAS